MLVLNRWKGEAIRIGDDITIRVLRVQGDEIFLQCKAPRNIRVQKEEVFRRVEAERLQRSAAEAAKKKE